MYLVNKAVINNILYDEFEERINGDLFKKVFVIDIRNFNESELNEFYNNFFDFQDELLSDTFFFKHKNLSLYIICEEDQKEDNRARKITYDLHYADKKFLTENEFSLICKYSKDSILEDNRYTFSYENKEIQIDYLSFVNTKFILILYHD